MAKNRQDNRSDTDLVVHSLTVMGSMKGAGIRAIRDSVRMLQNAQTTLAEKTRDYWTAIASDSVITPDEKKTLWKEWKVLVQEYADLVQSAEEEHQISQVADPLIAYKAAYLTLYTLVVTNLKLFDNMRQNTQLSDRTAFIAAYTDYFAARDALRDAIRDGEDARVEQVARDLAAQAQEQIQRVSLGGMAAASVDYARNGTGLEQRLTQITEAGSNAAFLGLSVGIPYFLTASAYDEWARLLINDPAGLEYLYNIYERVQTTSGGTGGSPVYFYRMKVSATDAQVRSLKNKLLVLDALRSVITLDADLVQIHGDSVFSSDTTIEKSVKDYIGKSIAQLLMGSDGSDAGFDGTTIINGGFIKTDLINVNRLVAQQAFLNFLSGGSATFTGEINARGGTFNHITIDENSQIHGTIDNNVFSVAQAPDTWDVNYPAGSQEYPAFNNVDSYKDLYYQGEKILAGAVNYGSWIVRGTLSRGPYYFTRDWSKAYDSRGTYVCIYDGSRYVYERGANFADFFPENAYIGAETDPWIRITSSGSGINEIGYWALTLIITQNHVYKFLDVKYTKWDPGDGAPDDEIYRAKLDGVLTVRYRGLYFILKNLPSTNPNIKNVVWNDNGTLKIS